jgi:hypothetical protein
MTLSDEYWCFAINLSGRNAFQNLVWTAYGLAGREDL